MNQADIKKSNFSDNFRKMERGDFSYFLQENTLWGDADAMGHINNVQYARYYESARVAYFEELLGFKFVNKTPVSVITADLRVCYLQQLHHPSVMQVGARVSRLGNSSLHFDSAIFLKGQPQPISTSHAILVWFDFVQNQSFKIPQQTRQTIIDYETLIPAQA